MNRFILMWKWGKIITGGGEDVPKMARVKSRFTFISISVNQLRPVIIGVECQTSPYAQGLRYVS